jgi:uncharacterized protein YndB with AHSA1/START domain
MAAPTGTAIEPIRKSALVALPVAEAFALFTDRLDTWWPLDTHSIAADTFEGRVSVEAVIVEPRVSRRVLERMSDGTEAAWGRILVWEPPARLVMTWNPTLEERPETEVELRFADAGGGATRIGLEHRGWERLGPDAVKRTGYDDGWGSLFERLERVVAGR